MAQYLIANGASPTTAAQVAVTTGTSLKTLLQVEPSATAIARIVEWGISFDGSAAATPIKVELLEQDVAATVTAHVAAGIVKFDAAAQLGGDPTTNLFQVGTANTGYTSTAENSPTVSRMFDVQFIAPTNQYIKQFPLGSQPALQNSKFTKIRVTAGAAVNAYCYMIIEI
ncbi:MAG TPA: hypothetical protein VFC63_19280 [Blastocatellia bacterium]|nr:hypothetical protein [Blastocatellia bacterium]